MRWVKHLSTAHNDPEVDRLLEECGAEGYGAYWLIIEDIAGPMEQGRMEPEATHSDLKWSQIAHVHRLTWRSLKQKLGSKLLVITQSDDGRVRIAAPNILKYKDEYSKKSGHTPELSRYRADTDTEAEKDGACVPPKKPPKTKPLPEPEENCTRIDREANAALARMFERHPYPSNPLDAAYQFQRIVQTAVNPDAVIESSEKNHAAWCEYWTKKAAEDGRAPWMPKLAEFFHNGYHAKAPPARDGPVPMKKPAKTKQEHEAEAAREQFEKLSQQKIK